jgi:hypothetical protein
VTQRRSWAVAVLATAAACSPAPAPRVSDPAPLPVTPRSAALPSPAPTPTSQPARSCPPIDEAKLRPPVCDDAASLLKTPVPPIADGGHSLASFYEAYAALARGRAQEHVRIAMYGDSNLTMDELTGQLRRQLQQRFGDAGHGFVALALPWHWYEHQDVHHHGQWDHFRQISTATAPIGDQHYGMANMAAESTTPNGSVWVATADGASPIGTKASRFDVFFLRRPGGGSFDLSCDGTVLRTVSTRASTFEVGMEHVELPDAAHKLTFTVKTQAPVRFYGATLERAEPSIVVDSLGASALNFSQLRFAKPDTRSPMWRRRDYRLVMFQVGTNTFALETHREDVKAFLAELRTALPGVSILLMSPPDAMKDWNDAHSDPRIVTVSRQLREIAAETGTAFWDYREAMGGDTSIRTFIRQGLATADRIHLKREGSELMADRFLCALSKDFSAWLAEHPEAGCGR